MTEPLSQKMFDLWKESDDAFKAEVRDHMAAQTKINLDQHGRVTALEVYRHNDAIKLGIFSTFVSAIFGSVAAFWRA